MLKEIIGIKKVSRFFCNLLHAFSMAFFSGFMKLEYSKCNKLSSVSHPEIFTFYEQTPTEGAHKNMER